MIRKSPHHGTRRDRGARLAVFLASVTAVLGAAPAHAYTIGTGFTEGCHERITADAFGDVVDALGEVPVEVPAGDTWRSTAAFLIEASGSDASSLTDLQLFLLHSLLVGIRAPDTDGHAVLNLDAARALHTDPDPRGQYVHALRATSDDFEQGNINAVAGMRAAMRDEFELFRQLGGGPESIKRVSVYYDFYGRVEVEVWSPAFHLGQLAHAVQDSFSHSIRDEADGFRSIVTVLNFSEAVTGTLDEERDGYAHSIVLDSCDEETAPVVAAATQATAELMQAAIAVGTGADAGAFDPFLDRWVSRRAGCDESNELCGNQHWLDLARSDRTEPYLCGAGGPHPMAPAPPMFLTLLAALTWLMLRRRRRRVARGRTP